MFWSKEEILCKDKTTTTTTVSFFFLFYIERESKTGSGNEDTVSSIFLFYISGMKSQKYRLWTSNFN